MDWERDRVKFRGAGPAVRKLKQWGRCLSPPLPWKHSIAAFNPWTVVYYQWSHL